MRVEGRGDGQPREGEPAARPIGEALLVEGAEDPDDAADAPAQATREDPEVRGAIEAGEVVEGEEEGDALFGDVHEPTLHGH